MNHSRTKKTAQHKTGYWYRPSDCVLFGGLMLISIIVLATFTTACTKQKNASNPTLSDNLKTFCLTGFVKEINPSHKSVVIAHEAVPNFMPAMMMPFDVLDTNALAGIIVSNRVTFRLTVAVDRSWIDQIKILDTGLATTNAPAPNENTTAADPSLMFTFTNEFGRAVKMTDFAGQALAMNFFFTRCPLPNACPRSSQNFSQASRRLAGRPGVPTNWHFLSISIDSEFDTPAILQAYGKRYQYDSNHWTFLTGPKERVENMTRLFGFDFKPDSGVFSHGFRTVILTPSNKVQQIFPISGDLTDAITEEMLKALGAHEPTK